jgi:hypothetical protein
MLKFPPLMGLLHLSDSPESTEPVKVYRILYRILDCALAPDAQLGLPVSSKHSSLFFIILHEINPPPVFYHRKLRFRQSH